MLEQYVSYQPLLIDISLDTSAGTINNYADADRKSNKLHFPPPTAVTASSVQLTSGNSLWLASFVWDSARQPTYEVDCREHETEHFSMFHFPSYSDEELLKWEGFIDNPPPRPSGKIKVKLRYRGRSKPFPADSPWAD